MLIGIEDGTRAVRGVSEPLALEERIASLVSDSILPRLLPDIEVLAFRSTHVLAVRIYPSAARPHYLARSGPKASAYVRVGSTNRRADAELLADMRRFVRGEAFDEQPMPDLTADPKDRTILDALGTADGLRTREVSDVTGLSVRAARQRLARLVESGEVREIGSGPNDPQRRYFRADA